MRERGREREGERDRERQRERDRERENKRERPTFASTATDRVGLASIKRPRQGKRDEVFLSPTLPTSPTRSIERF